MCRNRYVYFFAHKNIHILCTTHACVCVWTLYIYHMCEFLCESVYLCVNRGESRCLPYFWNTSVLPTTNVPYITSVFPRSQCVCMCVNGRGLRCTCPPHVERMLRLHWILNSEIWSISHMLCAFFAHMHYFLCEWHESNTDMSPECISGLHHI